MASHLGFGQPWIYEPDDAPLDAASGYRNFVTRLEQAVVNVVPLPKVRFDSRFGIGRTLGMIEIPQTGNPTGAKQIVELLNFFGRFHVFSLGKWRSKRSIRSNRLHGTVRSVFPRTAGTIETIGTRR